MKSVGAMLKQLAGLVNTRDLSEWEQKFVTDNLLRTNQGRVTSALSDAQIETIESIFNKHFAG